MYDQWIHNVEEGKTVAVLMIDQSAAFDVCDHPILEGKMQLLLGLGDNNEGKNQPVMRWIHSYLSARTQCTIVEGQVSPLLRLPACSVIQGGCGVGLLYAVMTSDLAHSIHSHPVTQTEPAAYCEKDGDMTTFVDDSTSYFGHKNALKVKEVTQRNYDLIEDYMNSNLLKINGDKSHLIVLTKGNGVAGGVAAAGRRAQVSLVAGGKVIQASEQETLLGGVIHQSGNWRMFIRDGKGSIIKQISTRMGA